MTNNIPYVSSTVMDKIMKIAAKKYKCDYDDIGLVEMQSRKKTYTKQGIELASDEITFVLYDNSMNKLGVVKREEVKKFTYPKKQPEDSRATAQ